MIEDPWRWSEKCAGIALILADWSSAHSCLVRRSLIPSLESDSSRYPEPHCNLKSTLFTLCLRKSGPNTQNSTCSYNVQQSDSSDTSSTSDSASASPDSNSTNSRPDSRSSRFVCSTRLHCSRSRALLASPCSYVWWIFVCICSRMQCTSICITRRQRTQKQRRVKQAQLLVCTVDYFRYIVLWKNRITVFVLKWKVKYD